jgi:hypothetical protein
LVVLPRWIPYEGGKTKSDGGVESSENCWVVQREVADGEGTFVGRKT